MNKRKGLLVFLFALCFSFFMIGCKKKSTTTKNNTTIKTTEKQNSSNNKTTNLTTNKKTVSSTTTKKTTTKKTTAKQTTTEVNTKTTLIDLFESYSSLSASIKYSEDGSIKTTSESTYIEENTPIDITFTYFSDYLITITDGDTVNTYYLFYNGSSISLGGEEITPQTFEIKEYLPKTKLVKIENKGLDSYAIFYDKNVDDVTMELDGSNYAYKANAYVKEGKKVNAKIKNNSGNRVLFEIYKYDEESNPTIFVESQIINVNATYEIPEFTMPTYKLCFRVSAYITYKVTFNDMATSDNITYDFKAILDGVEKTVVSGEEYLDGSKIKAVITNNSNKDMVFKITDESNHKVFITTIKKNTTYTASESEYITLDKNILLYSELIDYLNVNLKSNVEGVTYVITDIEGIGYNFGPVRAGYLRINVTNNTSSSIMTSAYDDDDNGIQLSIIKAGETGYIFVQHFDMNVNIYTEECPDDKKFYIDCGFYNFKVYDRNNNELSFDDGFSIGQSVTLYIDMAVMTDTSIYAYDFTNKLIAGGTIYANSSNTKLYLSLNIYSDVKVYVEQKSDNEIIKVDISFNMMNTSVTISDENGVILEPFNNYAIVTKGTKLTVTVFDPNDNFKIYSYYYDENDQRVDVIPETRVNKNQEKTFNFTINHDIEIRYMFV